MADDDVAGGVAARSAWQSPGGSASTSMPCPGWRRLTAAGAAVAEGVCTRWRGPAIGVHEATDAHARWRCTSGRHRRAFRPGGAGSTACRSSNVVWCTCCRRRGRRRCRYRPWSRRSCRRPSWQSPAVLIGSGVPSAVLVVLHAPAGAAAERLAEGGGAAVGGSQARHAGAVAVALDAAALVARRARVRGRVRRVGRCCTVRACRSLPSTGHVAVVDGVGGDAGAVADVLLAVARGLLARPAVPFGTWLVPHAPAALQVNVWQYAVGAALAGGVALHARGRVALPLQRVPPSSLQVRVERQRRVRGHAVRAHVHRAAVVVDRHVGVVVDRHLVAAPCRCSSCSRAASGR